MDAADVSVVSSRDRRGGLVVRIGIPLVDVYLEFLGGRCRPSTVLAAAYDLKVFFAVVARPADQVRPADVLGFIIAQRAGRGGSRVLQAVGVAGESGGVSAATVRRRLSIVSGFFAFLQARGDVAASPVPRGLPTRRERSRPGQGVPLVRAARRLPRILAPAEVDALMAALRTNRDQAMVAVRARRAAPLRGPRAAAGGPAGGRAAGVHRRGQGRPAAADPGLGLVLRRGGCLPGRRAAARRRHRPGFVVLKGPRRGQPLSATGVEEILAGARRRAGLEHATCHELRHTCLTRLQRRGVAIGCNIPGLA